MSIKNSTIIVASLILLGRVSGFIREWLLSSISGANEQTDVAVILFTFPDLIVSLLLGGGLATTLIPYLGSLENKKRKKFINQVAFLIFIVFFIFAFLFSFNLNLLWGLLAPGINETIRRDSNIFFIIIIFCIPITAITGVLSAYLNSKSKFKIAASGTFLFNSGIIIGLLLNIPILWRITIGVIIGTVLRFLSQNNFIKLFKDLRNIFDENLIKKEFLKIFIFNFSFVTSIILMPSIGRSWASNISSGSLTIFSYANRLIELPIGVIIGSLTTVLLTKLTNDSSISNIIKSIKIVFLVTLTISIPAIIFSPLIVKIIYFKGQFEKYQLEDLISITRIGYYFLVPQALINLFSTIIAARKKQKILIPVGISMIALSNLLCYIFSFNGNLEGIVYANGITYCFISILLYILINKFIDKRINKQLITFEIK